MNAELKISLIGNRKLIIAEALMIAVIFHLVLLVSFDYAPQKAKLSSQEEPIISLLNMPDTKSPAGKELLNWLEYRDPSVVSSPYSKYSYSATNRKPAFRKPLPDQPLPEAMPSPPKVSFPRFEKLSANTNKQYDAAFHFINYSTVPPAVEQTDSSKVAIPPKYPLSLLNNSIPVELELDSSLAELGKEVSAEPTLVKLYPGEQEDLMPRIDVMSSSGSQTLDMAAVRALLLKTKELSRSTPQFVTVYWRQEEQK